MLSDPVRPTETQPTPTSVPSKPTTPTPETAAPLPRRLRPGGKARPSEQKAELRKKKTERTRQRTWTQQFLSGGQEALEEVETHGTDRLRGRGEVFRHRVFVPPQQRVADDAAVQRGQIVQLRGLYAYVWHNGRELPCTLRGALKSFATRDRKVVVVGDFVAYRLVGEAEGVIEAVEPRRTTLARADSRHPDREHVVAANVDQIAIVASLRQPELRSRLVDRYLVSAAKGGLEPLICLNKADLGDADELAHWVGVWGRLGYRVLGTSAASGLGIEPLRAALAGRTTVVAGQSGVGKSSLLNAVQPGLNLRVGEISSETDKGRHTTTGVTLLALRGDGSASSAVLGSVMDTPGIRSFGLWDLIPEEIEGYFPEFVDRVAGCKFADCTHRHEVSCAIKAAVAAGGIAPERYESYLAIYESLESGRIDMRD